MLVAVTGGIAAGKSTVARTFEECGAVVVDADQLARQAVAPGSPGLTEVVHEFGAQILQPDGTLNRAALAAVVFGNEKQRRRLEGILHPHIQRLAREAFGRAMADNPAAIVVYDVPLLAEASAAHDFDVVVVVEAPDDVRVARLREERGLTQEEAFARVAAQATNAERRSLANYLIDSSGSLADTQRQARQTWRLIETGRDS